MSQTTHLTHRDTAQNMNPLNVTTFDMFYKLKLKLHIVRPLDEVCTFLHSHKHHFFTCIMLSFCLSIFPFIVTVVSLTDCTLHVQKLPCKKMRTSKLTTLCLTHATSQASVSGTVPTYWTTKCHIPQGHN
jgi:hypothetical protein